GRFRARISYSPDSVGVEFAQLLNVIFGNSSIQKGIRVIGFEPGTSLCARFAGPRFGSAGLRARTGRITGGMIAPVIKPQGLCADDLAKIAYLCARAGADIIKEDHGLADQPMAPFRERVAKITAAVARANAETGGNALYFPNVAGQFDQIEANMRFAAEAGVGGLLVIPGLLGFGLVQHIAANASLNLPVMTHPAFLGPFVLSQDTGISHAVLFGTLQRLAGADISVFPNVGGRFGFTAAECTDIAEACRSVQGPGRPMLPSPGGGMTVDRAAEMAAMYGDDVVYLLGGSLLRHADQIGNAIGAMRAVLDQKT
ncbi:MAG: RuBisCO large subunit C-terminal-like domain-containing protein, partial [Paracoccaceae bacterium]|nr:RuBisCO large subunit C-terminal-like domain-containing protein [Paracoccaceae bacterium]